MNEADYNARTEQNRIAKQKRNAAMSITVGDDAPDEEVSVSTLVEKLRKGEEHNGKVNAERMIREQMSRTLADRRREFEEMYERATALREESDELDRRANLIESDVQDTSNKLASAPPVPAPFDPAQIQGEIAGAEEKNSACSQAGREKEAWEGSAGLGKGIASIDGKHRGQAGEHQETYGRGRNARP